MNNNADAYFALNINVDTRSTVVNGYA